MDKATFVYQKDTYNAYDAQRIVFEASKYKSEIIFEDGSKRANAKSIIGLLSMKFLKGDEYTVRAEGRTAAPRRARSPISFPNCKEREIAFFAAALRQRRICRFAAFSLPKNCERDPWQNLYIYIFIRNTACWTGRAR